VEDSSGGHRRLFQDPSGGQVPCVLRIPISYR